MSELRLVRPVLRSDIFSLFLVERCLDHSLFLLKAYNKQFLSELKLIPAICYEKMTMECLKGAFQTTNYIMLIFEMHEGGTLLHYLHSRYLKEKEVSSIVSYLIIMEYNLHKKGHCLMDTRLENFMMDSRGHITPISIMKRPDVLPPEYYAPEKIACEKCDIRTDIWAMGVLVYHLLTKKLPFTSEDYVELYYMIRNDIPNLTGLSDEAADFVSMLLAKDPSNRPTVAQIKAHAFVYSKTPDIVEEKEYEKVSTFWDRQKDPEMPFIDGEKEKLEDVSIKEIPDADQYIGFDIDTAIADELVKSRVHELSWEEQFYE